MTEELTDRQQVEEVFALTGGELMDGPWQPMADDREWTFHYWTEFPPAYATEDLDPMADYRTVIRDDMFGEAPDTLTDGGDTWVKVARFGSSGETELTSSDGKPTGEYIYLGDGWGETVYRREPGDRRAMPADAGCWIDGHWGQYGIARVIDIAVSHGWDDAEADDLATRHLASIGPSSAPDLTNDEFERLVAAADDAEIWLNEHVAPDGFYFEWSDGEFFLTEETEPCRLHSDPDCTDPACIGVALSEARQTETIPNAIKFPYFDGGILFTGPTTTGGYNAMRRVFGDEFASLPPASRQLIVADFVWAIDNGVQDSADSYRRSIGADNLRLYVDVLLAGAESRTRS